MSLNQPQVCDLLMGFSSSVLFRRSSSKQNQSDGSSEDEEENSEAIESKQIESQYRHQRRKPFMLNTLHSVYAYLQTIKRLYEGYSLNRFSLYVLFASF